jgi:hypothetical protein
VADPARRVGGVCAASTSDAAGSEAGADDVTPTAAPAPAVAVTVATVTSSTSRVDGRTRETVMGSCTVVDRRS